MQSRYLHSFIGFSLIAFAGLSGCKSAATNGNLANAANVTRVETTQLPPEALGTPLKDIKAADIAKLKWIVGDWRGMDGERPFFERYRFEGTTMIVEGFDDDSFAKPVAPERFELKDGEFGHSDAKGNRAAASSITDDAVQFVPVSGVGNSFRFERQPDGKWRAVLEWPAKGDKPAGKKVYQMEPVKSGKKD